MTYAIVRDVLYVAKLSCHKNVRGGVMSNQFIPFTMDIIEDVYNIMRAQQVLNKFRFRCQDTATCQHATRAVARAKVVSLRFSTSTITRQPEAKNSFDSLECSQIQRQWCQDSILRGFP